MVKTKYVSLRNLFIASVKLQGNGLPNSPRNFVSMILCALMQMILYLHIVRVRFLWLY